MTKSIPLLVLDKVRQVLESEVLYSNVLVKNVTNKSLSQESNNVLFCSCCCKDEQMLLCHQMFNSVLTSIILYIKVSVNFSKCWCCCRIQNFLKFQFQMVRYSNGRSIDCPMY